MSRLHGMLFLSDDLDTRDGRIVELAKYRIPSIQEKNLPNSGAKFEYLLDFCGCIDRGC